jgi:hypothetical protein
VEQDQKNLPANEVIARREISDTNARLAARLTQLLNTPGISDKDRKLVERNLHRLQTAMRTG